MNILIVSYSFWPRESPRSYRATYLAEELSKNHNVCVLAVAPSIWGSVDIEMIDMGSPWWTSRKTHLGKRLVSIMTRSSRRLYYPEVTLVYRVVKSIFHIRKRTFDLTISIGLPESIHWGVGLSKSTGILNSAKIVADCGDPYVSNPFGKKPLFLLRLIDKRVLKGFDFVSVPTEGSIQAYNFLKSNKIKVIRHGFPIPKNSIQLDKTNSTIRFVYTGTIYKGKRDPTLFIEYLETLSGIDFEFHIYSRESKYLHNRKLLDEDKLILHDYIPRKLLMKELVKYDFCINLTNPSEVQSPSKLYDYIILKKPILDIGSVDLNYHKIKKYLNREYDSLDYEKIINEINIVNVAKSFVCLRQS